MVAELDTSALPDKPAFAAANGWRYEASAPAPGFQGAIFEFLQGATVTDRFARDAGDFEVGVVTGKVGGGQAWAGTGGAVKVSFSTDEVMTFGYLAVKLQRKLPQFVLDSSKNDDGRFSNLPMPIAAGQQLSLEGDFDKHFTLHSPHGYERDALYIFTPDLMGLLIDETGDFDVEVVDEWFFVYARGGWDLSNATLWRRLDRIRDIVGAKAITQTDLYADSRDPATIAEGSRLRMGFFGGRSRIGIKLGIILVLSLVLLFGAGIVGIVVFFI